MFSPRPVMKLALLFILLPLAACQTTIPVPQELTFSRYQPIYMDVSKIDIIDEYQPPMHLPNIDHLVPYSPTEAMHIWVRDRLRAVGSDKTLQVIVKDGSIIATQLPKPGGLSGAFTISQDRRYDAKLDVEMRIYGSGDAMSEASIDVSATRSVTISERASPAERDAVFRRMIFDLMESMNAELEKNIFTYLGNSINYSHNP